MGDYASIQIDSKFLVSSIFQEEKKVFIAFFWNMWMVLCCVCGSVGCWSWWWWWVIIWKREKRCLHSFFKAVFKMMMVMMWMKNMESEKELQFSFWSKGKVFEMLPRPESILLFHSNFLREEKIRILSIYNQRNLWLCTWKLYDRYSYGGIDDINTMPFTALFKVKKWWWWWRGEKDKVVKRVALHFHSSPYSKKKIRGKLFLLFVCSGVWCSVFLVLTF